MSLTEKAIAFVKAQLQDAEGGHDWFHAERVLRTARYITKHEAGEFDTEAIDIGAIIHDVADRKFHGDNIEIGPRIARRFLEGEGARKELVEHVENIVRHISWSSNLQGQKWMSPELAIVQDADRLDGMGAIGIARTFNYGGYKNRPIFIPGGTDMNVLESPFFPNGCPSTIAHFPEKLFKLKDRMNTKTGRALAKKRHAFMLAFWKQIHRECEV